MGVKKNFVYSAVLTCSGYVFVFITYPYVSRVLGVENIGICNFVSSLQRKVKVKSRDFTRKLGRKIIL